MNDTTERVVTTIAQQLGVEESLVASTPKSAWYMDSLDEIEIVMALEDEFAVQILDDDAAGWKDLQDVVAYIDKKQEAA